LILIAACQIKIKLGIVIVLSGKGFHFEFGRMGVKTNSYSKMRAISQDASV